MDSKYRTDAVSHTHTLTDYYTQMADSHSDLHNKWYRHPMDMRFHGRSGGHFQSAAEGLQVKLPVKVSMTKEDFV